MTTDELRRELNNKFGIEVGWPPTYEVDHETYANICQEVFNYRAKVGIGSGVKVELGIHNGIKFRNVEFILKS